MRLFSVQCFFGLYWFAGQTSHRNSVKEIKAQSAVVLFKAQSESVNNEIMDHHPLKSAEHWCYS